MRRQLPDTTHSLSPTPSSQTHMHTINILRSRRLEERRKRRQRELAEDTADRCGGGKERCDLI